MDEPIFTSQESADSAPVAGAEFPSSEPSPPMPDSSVAAQQASTAGAPSHSGCDGSCGGGGQRAVDEGARSLGSSGSQFVYAIGRIDARIPNLGVEKEIAQAIGRTQTASLTDRQALFSVLNEPQNRYLTRQMCFVLETQGIETYIVIPRDPADYSLLVEGLGAFPHETDLQVVIGLRGPIAPPSLCNGLSLPVVGLDQIYSFDTASLVQSLPKPDSVDEAPFRAAADELFGRVIQVADNAGSSDEHRALNYLAVRYPQIYAVSAEAFTKGQRLTSIETRTSRLSAARNILDVLFSFTDRSTDVTEKFFVRVDVTEEFPFLVTKLSPYYDR
ncbi:cyanobactin maturation protease PatG family protein [Streptomyces sp. NPDC004980]